MWTNNDNDAAMKFHEATPEWFSTWDGTTSAMQVGGIGLRTVFFFFSFSGVMPSRLGLLAVALRKHSLPGCLLALLFAV